MSLFSRKLSGMRAVVKLNGNEHNVKFVGDIPPAGAYCKDTFDTVFVCSPCDDCGDEKRILVQASYKEASPKRKVIMPRRTDNKKDPKIGTIFSAYDDNETSKPKYPKAKGKKWALHDATGEELIKEWEQKPNAEELKKEMLPCALYQLSTFPDPSKRKKLIIEQKIIVELVDDINMASRFTLHPAMKIEEFEITRAMVLPEDYEGRIIVYDTHKQLPLYELGDAPIKLFNDGTVQIFECLKYDDEAGVIGDPSDIQTACPKVVAIYDTSGSMGRNDHNGVPESLQKSGAVQGFTSTEQFPAWLTCFGQTTGNVPLESFGVIRWVPTGASPIPSFRGYPQIKTYPRPRERVITVCIIDEYDYNAGSPAAIAAIEALAAGYRSQWETVKEMCYPNLVQAYLSGGTTADPSLGKWVSHMDDSFKEALWYQLYSRAWPVTIRQALVKRLMTGRIAFGAEFPDAAWWEKNTIPGYPDFTKWQPTT